MENKITPQILQGTNSFLNFWTMYQDSTGFYHFVGNLTSDRDKFFLSSTEWLMKVAKALDEEHLIEEYEENLKQKKNFFLKQYVVKYGVVATQTLLVSTINNYLVYLSEIITEIYQKYPEMILSTISVPLEVVYSYNDKDELLAWAVEQKVNDLSYKSFKDLNEFLKKNYQFTLVDNDEEFKKISDLILIRNLYVHNRGNINHRFLALVGNGYGSYGESIKLDFETTFHHAEFILKIVQSIDGKAISKFHLTNIQKDIS